jgi:Putative DNA-binding domain
MKRYTYVPFRGSLDSVEASELAGLREVSQGWYVEYSPILPATPQLAKQLSSFANESGGWLFVGVNPQEKGRMTAASFPGIAANTIEEALAALREAALLQVTPEVSFESRVIEGPVAKINLPPDRSIIVIGVPEGAIPPYVHSSGVIYTRAAKLAGPTPALDPRYLDVLRSRARETQERLAQFLSLEPGARERGKHAPVRVSVYLLNDPLLVSQSLNLSRVRFSEVMRSGAASGVFPGLFDNLFTTSDGYIARYLKNNDPFGEGLTFRWWMNGNARLSIPVDTSDANEFPPHSDPRRSDFVRIVRSLGVGETRIADFSGFLALLAAGTEKYLQLREVLGLNGPFWSKVRFCNAWQAAPFINLRQYIESIRLHGFPVVQDDHFYAPSGWSTDDLLKLQPGEYGGATGQSRLLALRLAATALRAVGIDFDSFISQDPRGLLRDLAESMNFVVEEPLAET